MSSSDWVLKLARQRAAMEQGESVAEALDWARPPIDPLVVAGGEKQFLRTIGDDFRDVFDGRLDFHRGMYFLFYNITYDDLPHKGDHHPRTRFSIAHELGHYFIDQHREYLRTGGKPHRSYSDFVSRKPDEREADSFAAGLLMPSHLLRKSVNLQPPNLQAVKQAAEDYQVSLTGMAIRWVRLCDFPCAVASISEGQVDWSFVSEGFERAGIRRSPPGRKVDSRPLLNFLEQEPSLTVYREDEDWGITGRWFECTRENVEVREQYVVVPVNRQLLVFITATEDDVA